MGGSACKGNETSDGEKAVTILAMLVYFAVLCFPILVTPIGCCLLIKAMREQDAAKKKREQEKKRKEQTGELEMEVVQQDQQAIQQVAQPMIAQPGMVQYASQYPMMGQMQPGMPQNFG